MQGYMRYRAYAFSCVITSIPLCIYITMSCRGGRSSTTVRAWNRAHSRVFYIEKHRWWSGWCYLMRLQWPTGPGSTARWAKMIFPRSQLRSWRSTWMMASGRSLTSSKTCLAGKWCGIPSRWMTCPRGLRELENGGPSRVSWICVASLSSVALCAKSQRKGNDGGP